MSKFDKSLDGLGLSKVSSIVKNWLANKQDKLGGVPGQVVGFGSDGVAKPIQGWSNPNLLDNWYFLDAINQRGEDAYQNESFSALYGIDRWYLSAAEWDASAHKLTATAKYGRIVQKLDGKDLVGKTVTFSILVRSVSGGNLYLYHGPGDHTGPHAGPGFSGVMSFTFEVPDPGNSETTIFIALSAAGASAVIDAVKLELGSQQTLAHQDVDGSWVLNDPPPNKALELLKCQKYQLNITEGISAYSHMFTVFPFESRNIARGSIPLPVKMRKTPALVVTGAISSIQAYQSETEYRYAASIGIKTVSSNSIILQISADTAFTENTPYAVRLMNGTTKILLDANL